MDGLEPMLDLLSAFSPQVSGIDNAIFFRLVTDYLDNEIVSAFNRVLSNTFAWVSSVALVLMSIWVWLQGYRIVTGHSREPMMQFFSQASQRVFILAVAFGFSVGGGDVFYWLANEMPREVNWIVTGEAESPAASIDRNLAYMQLAMSSIDLLQTGGDAAVQDAKTRSMWFAGLGTTGPAVVGGAMLLLNKIAMGLFVGFGPMFCMALLFDYTKPLFQKWLYYGIGTIFALVMLNLMVSIATEMVARVAAALWLGDIVRTFMGGGDSEGISSRALQQGGLGLILTTLIVSTPPMAAAFFNGVMGHFSGFNALGGGAVPNAQGQPMNPAYSYRAGDGQARGSASVATIDPRMTMDGARMSAGDTAFRNDDAVRTASSIGAASERAPGANGKGGHGGS